MLGDTDIAFESARSQFWVVDANVSDLLACLSVWIFLTCIFLITVPDCFISLKI